MRSFELTNFGLQYRTLRQQAINLIRCFILCLGTHVICKGILGVKKINEYLFVAKILLKYS